MQDVQNRHHFIVLVSGIVFIIITKHSLPQCKVKCLSKYTLIRS